MFVLAPEITPVTHLGLSGREAVTEMSFTQLEIHSSALSPTSLLDSRLLLSYWKLKHAVSMG